MSDDILATYSFLPWLRHGIANSIANDATDTSVKLRASIPVDMQITAENVSGGETTQTVHKDIQLYGPGDIVGIESRAIVKVEPRNWITNFEPNYMPYIEFYDEDFPWRYTPAAPAGEQLRPWIMLVALKEDEFEDGKNLQGRPLPFFTLKPGKTAAQLFPSWSGLWAWAHVHVNKNLASGNDTSTSTALANLDATLKADADYAYSRVLSSRKLEPDSWYTAFLIPVYESGRLAGLGQDIPTETPANLSAWDNNQNEFPYYHRWYFRTGSMGDFEYLVNILKPRPMDKRVGVRDMDVLHPGSSLPPINTPVEIGGILKLGGALRIPFDTLKAEDKAEVIKYDTWDESPYPHPFEEKIGKLINLPDDYAAKAPSDANPDGDPDPVISVPLYGRWHALVQRLLEERDGSAITNNRNWVHELNLDPRFRAPAGFGTGVIQKNQEEYMNAAWGQIGQVLEANLRIRLAQLAKETSFYFYSKHMQTLSVESSLIFTAPVQRRVLAQGISMQSVTVQSTTVQKAIENSVVPAAALSPALRRIARPRGRLLKRLPFDTGAQPRIHPGNLISRINEGEVLPAPPKTAPKGAIKLKDAAGALKPTNIPPFILNLLTRFPWLVYLPLLLLVLLFIFVVIFQPGGVLLAIFISLAVLLVVAYVQLRRWRDQLTPSESLDEEKETPESVDQLPRSGDFRISEPGSGFNPTRGGTDSEEALRFKQGLKSAYTLLQVRYPEPVRQKLDIPILGGLVLAALNPEMSIPKRTFESIHIPQRIRDQLLETFTPVMAYPIFDLPMYKPLADISSELFLPNINLIEQNTISLLETNQKFIESYMVGINHEMARELLWREYPTDQRGSYYRQFWDVSNYLPPQPVPADIIEKLRDIPELHKWSRNSDLGDHNQREAEGDEAQIVLVIRGELLKKYPTAVIYAQHAIWQKTNGVNDPERERILDDLLPEEEADPPRTKIKTPLFEAKIDPDIYFFGFDLTALQAKGGSTGQQDAGWFFVIKERPGEPRFGLDQGIGDTLPRLINWNNLSWKRVGTQDGSNLMINQTINLLPASAYDETIDQENKPNPEDAQAHWTPGTNAAELAYILYQVPAMVAVHAARMLPS